MKEYPAASLNDACENISRVVVLTGVHTEQHQPHLGTVRLVGARDLT